MPCLNKSLENKKKWVLLLRFQMILKTPRSFTEITAELARCIFTAKIQVRLSLTVINICRIFKNT